MAGRGTNTSSGNRGQPLPDYEPLKRAISTCVRAISGDSALEVTFSGDRPGISGDLKK